MSEHIITPNPSAHSTKIPNKPEIDILSTLFSELSGDMMQCAEGRFLVILYISQVHRQ